jgi:hypothetical protein
MCQASAVYLSEFTSEQQLHAQLTKANDFFEEALEAEWTIAAYKSIGRLLNRFTY